MELTLYKTNSADNVINKTLSNPLKIDIELRGKFDITTPSITLQHTGDIDFYNYCHMDVINKYYFIREVESVAFSVWRLNLECDVLETYKAGIFSSHLRYMRNLKTGDYQTINIGDNVKTDVSVLTSSKSLPNGESTILTTIGEGSQGV